MEQITRQNKSPEIGELIKAVSGLQKEMEPSKKTSESHLNKYSNLRECWNSVRELLAVNNLAVIQTFGGTAEQPSVITTLGHSSGQWIEGEMTMNPSKKDCQGQGGAATYGRRYGLCAILGIYQEDLDAEDTKKRTANSNIAHIKAKDKKKAEPMDPGGERSKPDPKLGTPAIISAPQIKRLQAIRKGAGWSDDQLDKLLSIYEYNSTTIILRDDYEKIITRLEKGPDGKSPQ